jgi:hypothetical protein
MSDFNGINHPGKKPGYGIPTGKQQPTPPPAEPTAPPLTGNAHQEADLKTPEHLYNLYTQQSQGVQQSVKMGQMMGSFEHQYAQATQAVTEAFVEDFGFQPPKPLLEKMVDRYMNGAQVVINQA